MMTVDLLSSYLKESLLAFSSRLSASTISSGFASVWMSSWSYMYKAGYKYKAHGESASVIPAVNLFEGQAIMDALKSDRRLQEIRVKRGILIHSYTDKYLKGRQ